MTIEASFKYGSGNDSETYDNIITKPGPYGVIGYHLSRVIGRCVVVRPDSSPIDKVSHYHALPVEFAALEMDELYKFGKTIYDEVAKQNEVQQKQPNE